MTYKFERERRDYTDLAAGRVLRGAPGATAFPVRLASELAQRALSHAAADVPLVYDPCCGGGYLLAVVGFLHGSRLCGAVGSDISAEAVSLCEQNLALLDADGLRARVEKLDRDLAAFGKDAHRDALRSAERLAALLPPRPLLRRTFVADAGDPDSLRTGLESLLPDVVVSDVPYGSASTWTGEGSAGAGALLASLAVTLRPGAIVALATSKRDRPGGDRFDRLEQWQVGKRALAVFRLR